MLLCNGLDIVFRYFFDFDWLYIFFKSDFKVDKLYNYIIKLFVVINELFIVCWNF